MACECTGPNGLSGQLVPPVAAARREIMAEGVRARDLMFLEQPADQCGGSGCLRRSKRVGFTADVFDADGTSVGAHNDSRNQYRLPSGKCRRCDR